MFTENSQGPEAVKLPKPTQRIFRTFGFYDRHPSQSRFLRDIHRYSRGPGGSAAELAAAVLMMLGYPCLMLAALVPSTPAFAAAAAVTYLADLYLHRKAPTSSTC